MVKLVRSLAAVALLALAWQSALAGVSVGIDRNPVQVNESFQLTFSLDHSPDREPDFSPLQQHFIILGNNRSSSISIINGEYRRSIKWTLQLMAKQIGEFMIPAIHFDKERSKPFQVTVKPSGMSSLPHDQLLLEMLADKQESYVQAQVIVTLRLLSATDISAYQFGDLSLSGLDVVVEPLGDVRQFQTRIADRNYLVLEKKVAIFPQQDGRLEIEPLLAEVRLPSRRNFDPFQTGGEIRRLRSQALAIEVKPIPADYQGDYWLPASGVELRETWQGDLGRLVAGEPVTRSLTLVAKGLTAAQLPELPLPVIDGVKQYPDQPVLEDERSHDGISGRREQKLALIPGAAGRYRVPEISLPWWNLERGEVEYATLPARELVVGAASAPPRAGTGAAAPAAQPAAAPVVAADGNRFWFWLSLALALGWGANAFYWWWRARRTPTAGNDGGERPDFRRARKRLREACRDNDAAIARRALLEWGQALLAPRAVLDLRQLAHRLGPELGHEIDFLNQSLYGRSRDAWHGARLAQLCERLEREQGRGDAADADLPPLNPPLVVER